MPIPKPDIEKIKTARKWRKKGLKYREIARVMESDVKTVYRWVNKYELSPGSALQVGK